MKETNKSSMVLEQIMRPMMGLVEDDFCNFDDPSPQKEEIELSKFMSSDHETRAFNSVHTKVESHD